LLNSFLGKDDIVTAIQNGRWCDYNDAYLLRLIGKIPKTAPPNIQAMRDRVVRRQRARLLWAHEELIASKKTTLEDEWYQRLGHHFDAKEGWKTNCIYWFKYFRPTDASPFASTYAREKKDDEKKEKSIHILTKNNKAKPLTEWRESFTRHLSNQGYLMVRVYYVGPQGADEEMSHREMRHLASRVRLADGLR